MNTDQTSVITADTPIIVSSGDASGTPMDGPKATLFVTSAAGFSQAEPKTKNLHIEVAEHRAQTLQVKENESDKPIFSADLGESFWMVMLQPPGVVIWSHNGREVKVQTANQFTQRPNNSNSFQDSKLLGEDITMTFLTLGASQVVGNLAGIWLHICYATEPAESDVESLSKAASAS